MKKILAVLIALLSGGAFATTTIPVQLLNSSGSSAGQVVVSTGSSSAPGWATVPLSGLSSISANTVLANATSSAAAPAAFSMPSCSTSASALGWTASTGFTCNASINAATISGNAVGTSGSSVPLLNAANTWSALQTYSSGITASGTNSIAGYAPLVSPALTGTPTAPTATAGTNTTQLATTAFVATSYAPLASPALTGTPTAPTASAGTSTTQIATTAFAQTAVTGGGNAGSFTTLAASGLISPTSTVGIKGTTAADSAQAGSWGEVITATNSAGSSLTSAVPLNVTSISLTAGDWYVWGNVYYNPSAAGWTAALSGINTTSGAVPGSTTGNLSQFNVATGAGMAQFNQVATPQRFNVSTTTTVYLVGALTFSSGTATCYGTISAWRRR